MSAKIRYNNAAIDGLLLASITIIISLIGTLGDFTVLSIILWIVKLAATMYALYYFMKRNTQLNTAEGITTTYGDAFKYGFLVSILSVVLITVYLYISLQFMDLDALMSKTEQQMEAYSSYSSSSNVIDWYLNHLESVTILSSLLLYTIWSLIASAIFANSTKSPATPFTNLTEE